MGVRKLNLVTTKPSVEVDLDGGVPVLVPPIAARGVRTAVPASKVQLIKILQARNTFRAWKGIASIRE